jgi:Domain of unknown function (DUF4919)
MTLRPLAILVSILLATLSLSAQTQQTPAASPQPTPKVVEKSTFKELVERAQKRDQSLDFTALRIAFYESPNYNPQRPMLTYRPLYGALAQKNYAEAIKIADSVLEGNFVELNAHIVAQIANQETGNTERAEFHKYMAEGLLNSIKAKADGKTTETAFQVISINEEYGLMRSMGLRPIKQSLLQDKGHYFDVLTVIDPQTNQESTVYFNVDKPFRWEKKN